jgi:hypothetical protein
MALSYLFGITIFLSSYLLFQVQLIVGKHLLPWFGGTSSMWTACMLFFQAMLLAGYGWAHFIGSKATRNKQALLQGLVLSAAIAALVIQYVSWNAPVLPVLGYEGGAAHHPVLRILTTLITAIGLPYFMLSTNSTLLQKWYFLRQNRSPYRLYAISNAGSFIGLISYPFILERLTNANTQAVIWFLLFLCYSALHLSIMVSMARRPHSDVPPGNIASEPEKKKHPKERMPFRQALVWIVLAATASTALLAFTNQITQEIAVIPFLWVIPLSIYLATFIVAFSAPGFYNRGFFGVLLGLFSLFVVFSLIRAKTVPVIVQITGFNITLFVICMICHGEVSLKKPEPKHLTSYYLCIAFGGVLGGLFVTLIAPAIFNGYWELHLSLVACAVLFAFLSGETSSKRRKRKKRSPAYYLFPASLVLVLLLHPVYYYRDSIYSQRNFYGVVRVEQKEVRDPASTVRFLMDGITTHGFQFTEKKYQWLPTCYYGRQSGVGLALAAHPLKKAGGNISVGAVGLGIGTVVAYGHQGDTYDFFEINPKVIALAEGERGLFTYLENARSAYRIIHGDGRISLEKMRDANEESMGRYDVLILDAFSSDSVPTHLLTEEAFSLYLELLKSDGIMAFHTSNRTLAVAWIVIQQAMNAGYPSAVIIAEGDKYSFASEWVLVTQNRAFLSLPDIEENIVPYEVFSQRYDIHLWTDQYSNLFEILK